VNVALGFQVSGKFAVVIGRDSSDKQDMQLRLRLFKQRKKGWNFALNASASVQPDLDKFVPEKFDDFVKAVFGTHGAQIVADLQVIEKWTGPDHSLPKLLGGVSADYFKEFLKDVTGIDPETAFDEAKERLQNFLTKWNNLDHEIATRLWKLVEEKVDLGGIRELVKKITETDEESIKKFLGELIADVDFFQTDVGKFLQALIPLDSILSALTDSRVFQKLQGAAQEASEILDGGLLEEILVNVQDNINKRLKLDKIEDVINETDFEKLDEWLKAKLSDFLGEKLGLSKLEDIRKTIHLLLDKRQGFFDKTLQALKRQYEFSFSAAYQKTTTSQALIDVIFDFSQPDVSDFLRQALDGKFDKLLVKKQPGVKLAVATLTHGINQQSHVELSLPFFKSSITHINNSLAKVGAVDEDEGRVLIYELGAKDTVIRKNERVSALAIGGYFSVNSNQLRIHSTDALTYSYTFKQAKKDMKRADLEYQLKPYINKYFESSFSAPHEDGVVSAPFDTWLCDLDKTIDQLEFNGTDNFGHTLLSLEVSLPSEIASAWLKAPTDKKAIQYMNMSRRLQAKLKELIPFYFFQNVENYNTNIPAWALLAYAAIPPSTSIRMSDNGLKEINTDKEVYWNWPDRKQQIAMLGNNLTLARLSQRLVHVHTRLKATPGMEAKANFYDPERATSFLKDVISDPHSERFFHALFAGESEIVKRACSAGLKLAQFVQSAGSKPSEAVKELADFGTQITKTFNRNISPIYGGDATRPLGTMMFIEAAFALNPQLTALHANAVLDLIVLKQTSNSDHGLFLNGGDIAEEDILLRERLIELAPIA